MREFIQKLVENPQAIIALCAVLISIFSIYLTIKTLKTLKQHDLKSVKPIGYISVGDYENNIYVGIDNNGIGPLLIKEFEVTNSDRSLSSKKNLFEIIPESIKNSVTWRDFIGQKVADRTIKPGDRLYFLQLVFDKIEMHHENNKKIKKELREFLQNLTVKVTYTDIYEKKKYIEIRELDWFRRNDYSHNKSKRYS